MLVDSNKNNNLCEVKDLPAITSNFIVKVIVDKTDEISDFIMYNKKRDIIYYISHLSDVGQILKYKIIKENMPEMAKAKGYFLACIKKGKFFINPEMLPQQNW